MASRTELLCDRLEETVCLLAQVQERHWLRWLRDCLEQIRNGDTSGLGKFRSAFGGMGSFNDLVIRQQNGHKVTSEEYPAINDRLESLRREIYRLMALTRLK
jgi:hypothetical protein